MKGTEDQMFVTNFKIEYKLLTFGNVQELLRWLRNVWRVRKTPVANPGSRYRLTDIVWYKHQEKVFEEIASILKIETANTNTPGWFQLRTKAAKNVIQSMNEEDRKELEDEAERMLKEGFPQDIQRKSVADHETSWPSVAELVRECPTDVIIIHRIAEDKWYDRLSAGAKKNFREMGLVQLSICVYTGKTGNLNVDM